MENADERLSFRQGSRDIIRLMLPCLAELLFGQMVSMIDMIMVGGLGTQAINAVGICGNPTLLLYMIFTALNVGTTALVSRAKGEGDMSKANEIALHSQWLNAVVGVVMLGVGFLFTDPLIAMMGSPNADTAALAAEYLRYRIIAMPAVAIGQANNAILRGMGNSRSPMIYNIINNVINVLFNWLLINGIGIFPQMGVTGAALATSIANICSTVISCILLLRGHSGIRINLFSRFRLNKTILVNTLHIGLPSMAEQIVFRVGLILYGRMTVSLGEVDYAAHQLCWNIMNMVMLFGSAMQMTTAPLTGQSLGRGDIRRAEDYNRYALWLLIGMLTVCSAVCWLLGRPLLLLYSPQPDVLEAAYPILCLCCAYLPLASFQYTYAGALAGSGDTKFNAPIMLISIICLRLPLAFLFKNIFEWGLMGINLALAADTLLRAILFSVRYRSGKWKTVKLQ